MEAYVHTHSQRRDGTRDCFATCRVDVKEKPLAWQVAGLTYTATGYGRRIPTRYVVRWGSKWRRVYCCQIANNGTLYIGSLADNLTVSLDR